MLSDGGRGIGVNPFGSDYPFLEPPDSLRYLFADIHLTYEVADAVLPLKLTEVSGVGVGRVDIVIADRNNLPIFASAGPETEYTARAFGDRFLIHTWATPTAICRAVQHIRWDSIEPPPSFAASPVIPGGGAILDERTNQLLPRRTLRFKVHDPQYLFPAVTTGDVKLTAGYNVAIKTAEDAPNDITFNVSPGSGIGRYPPDCNAIEPRLQTINGVAPDTNGHFHIAATGCYWTKQPAQIQIDITDGNRTINPMLATLKVGNDCGPCCTPEDYIRVQLAIQRIWDRFAAAAELYKQAKQLYDTALAAWKAAVECNKKSAVIVDVHAYNGNTLDITVQVCNITDDCLSDVVATVTVSPTLIYPEANQVVKLVDPLPKNIISTAPDNSRINVPVVRTDDSFQFTVPPMQPLMAKQVYMRLYYESDPGEGSPVVVDTVVSGPSSPLVTWPQHTQTKAYF